MPPTKKRRQKRTRREVPAARTHSPGARLWVSLSFTLGLLLISLTDRVQGTPSLAGSFWGSAALLLGWQGWLWLRMKEGAGASAFTVVLRPQHYLQACLQLAVFAYWGWYWRPVYDFAWLLAAQLVFAYAFGMLLAWSRKQPYVLGFGPFPIIFSTNLFLWFRDDWFYLQFLMIAVGFVGKELVRWNRDGRRVHIFNPSAFSLGLFSLLLIATNTSDLTWGQDIATTLSVAPRIYTFLFLIGLVAMYSFRITPIAATAAVTLFGWSALYSAVTGVPYFVDSEIPTAVFLGLHLLVTDPSTSPRTPLGKTVFGLLYGAGVIILFALLEAIGAPTFYDKLLAVPLLNLSVRWIDRLVRSVQENPSWSGLRPSWTWASANPTHMAVWIGFFALMTAAGRTDGRHTGDSLPFWQEACAEGRRNACDRLVQLEYAYCADNAGWACNELGAQLTRGQVLDRDPDLALGYFGRACELRFQPGCLNLLDRDGLVRAGPRVIDLRVLLREGGENLADVSPEDVHARACEHGWGSC